MSNCSRWVKVVKVDDSTAELKKADCTYLNKSQKGQAYSPYGLCTHPPNNSLGFALDVGGISSDMIVLIDDPLNRLKDLKEGETALYNYLNGSMVYLKEDGEIEISNEQGAKILLKTDGDVETSNNLIVNGTVTCDDIISRNNIDSFNDHIHDQGNDSDGDTQQPTDEPRNP